MTNNIRRNKNKGFSFINLIAIIIIVALIAVFGPYLLARVEKSIAKKDDSSMYEVVDAIRLALSERNVYDEVVYYSAYNNVSCYIDTITEPVSGKRETKTEVDLGGKGKSGPQYIFNNETRIADKTSYYAAGNMYGMTITFVPEGGSLTRRPMYNLKNGIINKFADGNDAARPITLTYTGPTPNASTMTLGEMKNGDSTKHYLYDYVRDAVGDTIKLKSQTYHNSEYTVFICLGSAGVVEKETIEVYGQWSGTNLD